MQLPHAAASPDNYLVSRGQAWFAFAMTFLLMMFDYIDRQIIVSMFPYLKSDWGLSDKELGALVSVVSLTVAIGAFPIAVFVDRWSRVKSIAIMAAIWSLATIACAFSRNFAQLFAARGLIGLGEAGYGAAGSALLASIFPKRLRATVIGGFLAAAAVGSVLGVVLGGVISAKYGWQVGFGVVGIPGVLLAVAYLLVKDYRTVPLSRAENAAERMRPLDVARELFRSKSAIAAYVGGALQLLTVSTVWAWLPSYLNRAYGLPGDQAGIRSAIVVLLGSVGLVVWSYVADRLARDNQANRLQVPAVAMLITATVLMFAFGYMAPGANQFLMICLGGFMMTAASGPIGAVVLDVVHPGLRATAAAMVAVVQNLFGLGAGPFITGALSDAYGLDTALAIMPVFCVLSAIALWIGSRSYAADHERTVTFVPAAA